MNSKSFFIILLALGLKGSGLYGQDATATTPPDDGAVLQSSLAESQRLFASGSSDDAAENTLQGVIHSPQDSGAAQLEVAMNLLRVAFSAQEAGDGKTAKRAAKRALARLDKAEKKMQGDDDALANINEVRGVIYDRLLGTSADAAQSYREALKHKPDSDSAKAKLRQVGGNNDQVGG